MTSSMWDSVVASFQESMYENGGKLFAKSGVCVCVLRRKA